MSAHASNVTQFPTREDKPREIVSFANGYLENLYYGNGWKRLAKILADNPGRVTPLKVHPWVCKIAKSEERPRTYDIAKMVSIMVTSCAHDVFREFAQEDAMKKSKNVVALKTRR